jgi:hypothetical protein
MEDVRAHLAGQSKDALVELLMSQAATDARLRDRLLLETAGGRSGGVDLATFRACGARKSWFLMLPPRDPRG